MVNKYKLKLSVLQQEIVKFLIMKAEKAFTAHAIARSLEVSQPGISKALPLLQKERLITIEKDRESKRLSIRLNRDNPYVIHTKRAENLKYIYPLKEYLEESLPGATIILFGSYARGEDTTSSDIDIAIIGRKEKELDLGRYEYMLERKIILNFYSALKHIHKELRENICNGILLSGGIEL